MSAPVPELDYTATVQRPSWTQLPHAVRRAVGAAAGSPVALADDPPGSGFTGSFAAVVHVVDGRSVFAKAGSGRNPHVLAALAQEATVLAGLPAGVPAARLVGSLGLDPGVVDEYAWWSRWCQAASHSRGPCLPSRRSTRRACWRPPR